MPFLTRSEVHIGISMLRTYSAKKLRELNSPVIIHDRAEPIRVLVPYEQFMRMQAIFDEAQLRGGG